MEKRTKLVIDENRWLRAGWHGGLIDSCDIGYDKEIHDNITTISSLLDSKTGRMCCLGFASCAAGATNKDITNISSPDQLETEIKAKVSGKFPWLINNNTGSNSEIACALIDINDDPEISLPHKRAQIKKIFADNGVDVVFVK